MRTSLRKLRGFTLHKHADAKDRRDLRTLAPLDELAQASRDMQDMRDCYDSLLSSAAATANSVYEFSESLQEMGACLLEKTALNDNEESGKVLLMLGKVQFELQNLVDSYRSHIFQTITVPSESLLNELQTVEEMKRQCDEKRNVCEYMVMRQREKGRSKSGKVETFSVQQLQAACDEYDELANLFVFRLKSLKQGQSRSLLTQAARHHAAQLCFFKKALKSLEAIEPHVKLVTEQQHIDYQFSGLEDDDGDDSVDDNDSSEPHCGELSFDYGQSGQDDDNVSTAGNSMELDDSDITFPQVATVETAKEIVDRSYRKSLSSSRDIGTGSQSAPLFAENKSDPAHKVKQIQPSSTWKFNTYALPTPADRMSSNSTGSGNPVPHTLKTSLSGRSHMWHSSPLDIKKFDRTMGSAKVSRSTVQSILRERNNNTTSTQLPLPLADGLLFSRLDPLGASDAKKMKRQSFSGPLTSKPWPTKPVSKEHPLLFSGPILRNPMAQPPASSLKVSSSASPTFTSSPKISELHELPRPPANSTLKSSRPMGLVGHSAPLVPKGQMPSATNKLVVSNAAVNAASPLPTPPQSIIRSFSIPSHKVTLFDVSKPLEAAQYTEMASPPLTPILLPNKQPSSTGAETVAQAVEIRGAL